VGTACSWGKGVREGGLSWSTWQIASDVGGGPCHCHTERYASLHARTCMHVLSPHPDHADGGDTSPGLSAGLQSGIRKAGIAELAKGGSGAELTAYERELAAVEATVEQGPAALGVRGRLLRPAGWLVCQHVSACSFLAVLPTCVSGMFMWGA
jgi:hypothetical protein